MTSHKLLRKSRRTSTQPKVVDSHKPEQTDHEAAETASPMFSDVMGMQRVIGNSGVQRLMRQPNMMQKSPFALMQRQQQIQREDEGGTLETGSQLLIDGELVGTYEEAVSWYGQRVLRLMEHKTQMENEDVSAPEALTDTIALGKAQVTAFNKRGSAPLDDADVESMLNWLDNYIDANNAAESIKAATAMRQMGDVESQLEELSKNLSEQFIPELRDMQRSLFRKDDENGLLAVADSIATALDCALTTKGTILQITEEVAALRLWTKPAKGVLLPDINTKATAVLEIAEKINKVYAGFQLARAAFDLASGGKTESAEVATAVNAMSTVISAGGTLLNATAFMSLYANLYLGPAVSSCLSMIAKIEDMRSKTHNRAAIAMGKFDLVNWFIEPGGRPMFDFMLKVMHAESSKDVPMPIPEMVDDYFVEQDDSFNAGVGGKDELPTTGVLWWEDTDDKKIAKWVYRNRQNLWGMLYGDCPVPN